MIENVIIVAVASSLLMVILWFVHKRINDAGIVDVGWALSLGIAGLTYAFFSDGWIYRRYVVGLLSSAWAFRLAIYLFFDRVLHSEEDGRYQALRNLWGNRFTGRMIWFFQAQALLAVILSISFLIPAYDQTPYFRVWELIAVCIWVVSLYGEIKSDEQLRKFRSRPENKGKTCRRGLWRYSRHPNYFFEWLHWWVYVLLAVGAPYWPLTLLSPVIMLVFILFITGIPPTEARALKSRGRDYEHYQRTTSAFVPWFPST